MVEGAGMDRHLAHQLLLACGASYSHIVDPRRCDWLAEPLRIERSVPPWRTTIDVALAGRMPQGVVIAFRGTLPPIGSLHTALEVMFDWANNGAASCRPHPDWPGRVHRGFAQSLCRLWNDSADGPGLEQVVEALLAEGGPYRLYLTGHSKGGALANLFAWRAARTWPDLPIEVATFGSARAGNEAFAQAFEADPRIDCTRYETALDMIPYLPMGWDREDAVKATVRRMWPALLNGDYRPVGRRVTATATLPEWRDRKAAELRAMFAGGFHPAAWRHDFLGAHLIGPGTDYDALVEREDCGSGVDAGETVDRGGGRE